MDERPTPAGGKTTEDRDAGFTLIELLVVIIIIGILAAIAIPALMRNREQGYIASMRSDLRTAAGLMETYAVENGTYPPNVAALTGELRTSRGNVLAVELSGDELVGFCLKATNPRVPEQVFYDNLAGGLQPVGSGCAVR